MGILAAFLMVSLDGFHATPDGDLDGHTSDPEFLRFGADQLDHAEMLVYGRNTYLAWRALSGRRRITRRRFA